MNQDSPLTSDESSSPEDPPLAELASAPRSSPSPGVSLAALSPEFSQLDERNVKVETISGLIFAAFVFTGIVIATGVVGWNLGLGWVLYLVGGLGILVAAITFWFALFWPRLEHRWASYRIDAEGLEIRRGVLWRHQLTVPMGRVQHADVSQGPLQRMFDLGTLTVHTAGTQNASVSLEGLAHERAVQIRDLIVRYRKEYDAV